MRRSFIGITIVSILALGACGTDESAGGLAKSFVKSAKKDGFEIDEACVKGVFSKLDKDQLKELAKFAKDDKVKMEDASAEIQATMGEAIGCTGSLGKDAVEDLVKEMTSSGGMDEACVRKVVEGFDGDTLKKLLEVNSSGDATQAGGLLEKLLPCATAG